MKIVCDIDSTVNDHWNRIIRNTVNGRIDEKKAFSRSEVMKDKVLDNALKANRILTRLHGVHWTWLTARNWEDAEDITEDWMFKHDFIFHQLVICKNMDEKIKILKNLKPDIYIDDFTSGQERGLNDLTFRSDVKKAIEDLGIKVFVAKNNWSKLLSGIRNFAGRNNGFE